MAQLYATINGGKDPVTLERATPRHPWAFAGDHKPDLVQTGPGQFSLLHGGRSYRVLVLKEDPENHTWRLRIGWRTYTVKLEDEQHHLLHEMGLDKAAAQVVRDIKAPMPGLVLKVLVKEGDKVGKNDPVLVLEAMKMENVIKAPGDAMVERVHVSERTAVEKGQLLLAFR
jgi:biotin carboxyl carrier protein